MLKTEWWSDDLQKLMGRNKAILRLGLAIHYENQQIEAVFAIR